MTWIFILPLFRFWKQKGKGFPFYIFPKDDDDERKLYIDVWETVVENVQLDGPRAKPVRVTFSMTEKPQTVVVSFCWWFLILFSAAVEGAKNRYTTLSKLFVHTIHLCFDNSTQILMIHTLKLWSRIFKIKQNIYFATICRRLEMWEDNCWCFGRIVVLCRRNTTTN